MKKALHLFAAITLLMAAAQAQTTGLLLDYAKKLSAIDTLGGSVVLQDAQTDQAGNVYVCGRMNYNARFGSQVVMQYTDSRHFTAKYSSSGAIQQVILLAPEFYTMGMAVEPDGHTWVWARLYDEADVHPGAPVMMAGTTGNESIVFIYYDPSGTPLQAHTLKDDTYAITPFSMKPYPGGGFTLSGFISNPADMDPTAGIYTIDNGNGYCAFLARYTATGSLSYALAMGQSPSADSRSYSHINDAQGNTYLCGAFIDTIDADPSPAISTLTSQGAYDAFVAKYSSTGALQQAINFGSKHSDAANDLVLNASGMLYVTGYFEDTADFLPGAGTAPLVSNGNYDIFLAKYSPQLGYLAATSYGNIESEEGAQLEANGTGVFLGGRLSSTVDFDPTPGTYTISTTGGEDLFIAALDSTGKATWAGPVGSSDDDYNMYLAATSGGHLFLATNAETPKDMDPSAATQNSIDYGTENGLLAQYHRITGAYQWHQQMGNLSSEYTQTKCRKITTDAAQNTYVYGTFDGRVDVDPGVGTTLLLSTGAYPELYFAKYDAQGQFLFAKSLSSSKNAYPTDLAVDPQGNIYITGSFQDTIDFDPSAAVTQRISFGGYDGFVAQYDTVGNFIRVRRISSIGDDFVNSVSLDDSSNIYIGGVFEDTIDIDPGNGTYNIISKGNQDGFLIKYNNDWSLAFGHTFGSSGTERVEEVEATGFGYYYLAGVFSGTVDFNPSATTSNRTSQGGYDVFLSAFTANGDYVHTRRFGGSGTDRDPVIRIDAATQQVYLTALFYDTATFSNNTGGPQFISRGGYDIIVAKFDSALAGYSHQVVAGTSTEQIEDLALDQEGRVWLVCNTGGNTLYTDTIVQSLAYEDNIVVVRLDTQLHSLYVLHQIYPNQDFELGSATTLPGGTLLLGGDANNWDVDFSPAVVTVTSINRFDAFFARYHEGTVISSITNVQTHNGIKAYPNPTHNELWVEWPAVSGNTQVSMTDITGRIVNESIVPTDVNRTAISVLGLTPGIYFLTINNYHTMKIVVQ